MQDLQKLILLVLIVANLAIPAAVVKFVFLDTSKRIERLKTNLQSAKQSNKEIQRLLVQPEDFVRLQKIVVERRKTLESFLPQSVQLIEVQKWIAAYAKEENLLIKSLKPLEEDALFLDREGKEVDSLMRVSKIRLTIEGTYAALTKFLDRIEHAKLAMMNVESAEVSPLKDSEEGAIEAKLTVDTIYKIEGAE